MAIQQNVLQLDISMCDASSVAVLDARDHLLEDTSSLSLLEPSLGIALDEAVEGASTHVLHDEENVLGGVDGFEHLDDVGVLHLHHQFDLTSDALLPVHVL